MPVSLTSSMVGVFPCSMPLRERLRGCAARGEGTTTCLLGAGRVTAALLDPNNDFLHHPPPAISASQPAWLSPAAAAPLTPCGQHISTQAASRIWNDAWQHWCQESSKGSFEELSPTLPSSHTHTAPRAGEMGELLLCRNSKILRMWAQCYSHH